MLSARYALERLCPVWVVRHQELGRAALSFDNGPADNAQTEVGVAGVWRATLRSSRNLYWMRAGTRHAIPCAHRNTFPSSVIVVFVLGTVWCRAEAPQRQDQQRVDVQWAASRQVRHVDCPGPRNDIVRRHVSRLAQHRRVTHRRPRRGTRFGVVSHGSVARS